MALLVLASVAEATVYNATLTFPVIQNGYATVALGRNDSDTLLKTGIEVLYGEGAYLNFNVTNMSSSNNISAIYLGVNVTSTDLPSYPGNKMGLVDLNNTIVTASYPDSFSLFNYTQPRYVAGAPNGWSKFYNNVSITTTGVQNLTVANTTIGTAALTNIKNSNVFALGFSYYQQFTAGLFSTEVVYVESSRGNYAPKLYALMSCDLQQDVDNDCTCSTYCYLKDYSNITCNGYNQNTGCTLMLDNTTLYVNKSRMVFQTSSSLGGLNNGKFITQ